MQFSWSFLVAEVLLLLNVINLFVLRPSNRFSCILFSHLTSLSFHAQCLHLPHSALARPLAQASRLDLHPVRFLSSTLFPSLHVADGRLCFSLSACPCVSCLWSSGPSTSSTMVSSFSDGKLETRRELDFLLRPDASWFTLSSFTLFFLWLSRSRYAKYALQACASIAVVNVVGLLIVFFKRDLGESTSTRFRSRRGLRVL